MMATGFAQMCISGCRKDGCVWLDFDSKMVTC